MRSNLFLALTLTLATLGGCAYSPQSVNLSPSINAGHSLINSPVVELSVVDNRSEKTLGTRGGVYQSNAISLAQPIEVTLNSAARKVLFEMGAGLDQPSPYPVELIISVNKISYQRGQTDTLPIEIKLDTDIRATARRDGKQYESGYQSSKTHKFFRIPNEQKNQEIINEILSETLTRMFNDPKLIRFIQQ